MTTQDLLIQALSTLVPVHISLDNESHMHAGFYEGKESHFKLVIVSDAFDGKRLAARHQMIYALINPYLIANGGTVHALVIHTYTPDEWQNNAPDSPNCAGQNKS